MRRLARVLPVLALVAACGGGSPSASPSPSRSPSASPAPSAAQPASPTPASYCPNQETGGSCVGALSAGEHATEGFAVPFRYRVPAGWDNEEDINGRYLLVAPGGKRNGFDDVLGDYVGVYTPFELAPADCSEAGDAGVPATPEAVTAALARRPGLVTTAPRSVTLGGLPGRTLDVRIAPAWTKSCPDGDPPFPLVPLIRGGHLPETIAHDATRGALIRLYFLTSPDGPVVVQVQDTSGGRRLARLDAVARSVQFR